jgi:hypothetical protein
MRTRAHIQPPFAARVADRLRAAHDVANDRAGYRFAGFGGDDTAMNLGCTRLREPEDESGCEQRDSHISAASRSGN